MFLGVDIGTTSTKAIVFSPQGEMKGISTQEYPLLVPQPGWAEQDPETILAAVIRAVREAIEASGVAQAEIAAVGFGAATHSLIALDRSAQPLTRNIIWADNRSAQQAERLKAEAGADELYRRTGAPIHPVSPVTKLLWMREEDPETFGQATRFVSMKEYLFYRLFDRFAVDHSLASAAGFLNLEGLCWDQGVLDRVGLRVDQLSELVPTTEVFRGMKREYAEAMGIDPDTPVVIGACDGVLANLGVGAIDPSQVAVTIGTSSAVRTVVDQPRVDPKQRTFCYNLTPDRWVIGGPSNNGGIILRWFRDNFGQPEVEQARQAGVDPYELLIERASSVAAGAEGLICLPYLSGERAPYWNPEARGVFFGVGLHHQRAHFVRSILEGVLLAVHSINIALRELAGTGQQIRASGGFARSPIWRQMMADITGYRVLVPEVYEASGFGGAVLAMYAVGAIDSLDAVQDMIRIRDRHEPDQAVREVYGRVFEVFERLYAENLEAFGVLADWRRLQN